MAAAYFVANDSEGEDDGSVFKREREKRGGWNKDN